MTGLKRLHCMTAMLLLVVFMLTQAVYASESGNSAATETSVGPVFTNEMQLPAALKTMDFSSGRLLVTAADPAVFEGDPAVISSIGSVYLLQYADAEQTATAYLYYREIAEAVEIDAPVFSADTASGDPEKDGESASSEASDLMTEEQNPFTEVTELLENDESYAAEPAYDIALIDTGSNYDIDALSVIGDDVTDENGHGTSMTGYVLEQAPEASILSIKALDGEGRGEISSVYAALQYAVSKRIPVINLSLSAKAGAKSAVIREAVCEAKEQGLLVVGAAGNFGRDAKYYIPGQIEEAVIAGSCDENGIRLSFSNFGETVDCNVVSGSTSEAAAKLSGYLTVHGTDSLHAEAGNGLIFAADPQGEQSEPLDSSPQVTVSSLSSYFTAPTRMPVTELPELLSLNQQTGGQVRKLFDYQDAVRTDIYAPSKLSGYTEYDMQAVAVPGAKNSYYTYGVNENSKDRNGRYYNSGRTGFDTYYQNGFVLRATLRKTWFSGINSVTGNVPRMIITSEQDERGSWFGGHLLSSSKSPSVPGDLYYCQVQPTADTVNPDYYLYSYWHVEVYKWNGDSPYSASRDFAEEDYIHLTEYKDLFFGFNDLDKLQSGANESEPFSPSNTYRSPIEMFQTKNSTPGAVQGSLHNYLQTSPTTDDLIWFYNDYIYGDFDDGTLYQKSEKIGTEEGLDVVFGFGGGNWAAMELYTLYYPVQYLAESGGRITGISEEQAVSGFQASGTSQDADPGYSFTGWTADRDVHLADGTVLLKGEVLPSDEALKSMIVDQPLVLTAHYRENYEAAGEAVIPVRKELTNGDLSAHTFRFGLYQDPACKKRIAIAQTDSSGRASFTVPVTSETRGDFIQTFYVREIAGTETGMSYDSRVYRADVTVTDNGDHTLSGAADQISLVSKTVSDSLLSDQAAISSGTISGHSFRLGPLEVVGYSGGYSGSSSVSSDTPSGKEQKVYTLTTGTGDADVGLAQKIQGFTSGDDLTFSVWMKSKSGNPQAAAGLYQSVSDGATKYPTSYAQKIPLTEVRSDNGWTLYEGTIRAILNPQLNAYLVFGFSNTASSAQFTLPMLSLSGIRYTDADELVFVNEYTASGTAQISAEKQLLHAEIADYRFDFGLYESEEAATPLQTAKNDSTGNIGFTLNYDQKDIGQTKTCYIREIAGSDPDIAYSSDCFPVQIAVQDAGGGVLHTEVTYPQGTPVFVNDYTKVPSTYTIEVQKTVTGNLGNKEESFAFLLQADAERIGEAELSFSLNGGGAQSFLLTDGAYAFSLKHGDQIVFSGIPDGAVYSVTETDADRNGYRTQIPDGAEGALNQNVRLTFVNRKNAAIPTGVKIPLYGGLSLAGAGSILLTMLLFRSTKKRKQR